MRFKLLAGLHEQADPDWQRPDDAPPEARAPSRTYRTGEIVESDSDLVDKFGPQKFMYVGESRRKPSSLLDPRIGATDPAEDWKPGDPVPELRRKNPSTAPGGQVTSGFQQATGDPSGRTVSGPALRTGEGETAEDRMPGDQTIEQKKTAPNQATTLTPDEVEQRRKNPADMRPLDKLSDRPSGPGQVSQPKSGPVAPTTGQPKSADQGEDVSDEEYYQTLDGMSVPQLRSHASEAKVDLKGATTKADIIKRLKEAQEEE